MISSFSEESVQSEESSANSYESDDNKSKSKTSTLLFYDCIV